MLDLVLIRVNEGGDPNIVIDSQTKRYKSTEIVGRCIELDAQWKKSNIYSNLARSQADTLRMNYNKNNKMIADRKKANKEDPCSVLFFNFRILLKRI